MGKRTVRPQEKAFIKSKKLCTKLKWTILSAFTFSIIIAALQLVIKNQANIIDLIALKFSVLFSISIFVLSAFFSKAQNEAEIERRSGLIDNAFGTKIALCPSENYYDVNELENGVEKLLASIHENCMYTNRIAEKMIKKNLIKSLPIVIFMIVCFILGISKVSIFESILQLYLSVIFANELLDIYFLYSDTKKIEEGSRDIWSTYPKNRDSMDFTAKVVRLAINYECVITRASLILDEKIYYKLNDDIEREWEQFKKTYNIR